MKRTGRIFALLSVCLVCLCAYVTGGNAATIYVSNYGNGTCSLTNAQSAYNAASASDTIVFPAGTCTWTSALTIAKPLSIIGAGSGAGGTKLIATPPMSNGFFEITGITSSNLVRISGFYFEMKDMTPYTAIYVHDVAMDNIRINHNIFNQGNRAILFYNPKGLIDNNYFYNANLTIEYSAGSVAKANASWASMAAGTADALFIEDNHFIDDANYLRNYTNERVGTFNGGKLVVRYNTFSSYNIPDAAGTVYPIMTHGSAAGGVANGYWQIGTGARRGQSVVEIYNNVMEGKRIDFPVTVRGSANLIYSNTITTVSRIAPRIYLREEEYDVGSNWSPLRTAWPAEDQVHNTFIWNNTANGTRMNSDPSTYFAIVPNASAGLQKDRDYFLHAPCGASDTTDAYGNACTHGKESFTGLNGASGSYPTDGTVYPTLGTMIFTAVGPNAYYGYTPYTYPHPLR